MFKRRGVEVFAPELDKVFDSTEFQTVLFRDSLLKSGHKLILREPAKQKLADNGDVIIESEEESDEDAEGGEDEMLEEGGEDEFDEMAEDGEEEVDEGEGDDAKVVDDGADGDKEGDAGDDKPNPDAEEHKTDAP